MDNGDVMSVGRGRLQNNMEECEEEEDEPCHKSGPVALAPWSRPEGSSSRLAFGRLKAKLFETRLAAHVRRAQLALTDSIKHAGWAVEHKVGQRRRSAETKESWETTRSRKREKNCESQERS